ncbi:hypothetical protein PF006_g33555 [Phytophthora fragariae]|uniref:Uncharacterized protein n=1 Tax=Phytophthora fragariae TaxID=53985 RepID=A0A6A3D8M1_9STRA|nr:hypothetical protein PF003_g2572 [Phytophthora fragariae]KAE8917772.1 hypothetical protein PF009_g31909 [Phytophthora fragariae]KAE9053466.1 hypothetical protein PF006_g33555 [Phytophthora fragariae]
MSLWVTTVKQLKVVRLIRNEIPDGKNSGARNVVHEFSNLLIAAFEKAQEVLEGSFDHSIHIHKKRRL